MDQQKPLTYPAGTYLCFGAEREPFVVILAASQAKAWSDLQSLKACRAEKALNTARESVFGRGIEWALPAWSQDCMETIALGYEGPHKVKVRGLAAALSLGQPIGNGRDLGERGDGGGETVERKPAPIAPAPGGGVAKKLDFYAEAEVLQLEAAAS